MSQENKQRTEESKQAAKSIFMRNGRISPLERVQPSDKQLTALHISANHYKEDKTQKAINESKVKERQSASLSIINSLNSSNYIDSLGIWGEARTANSFSVKAQQALNPFMTLKENENVMFFDIEALGTPEHMRGKDSAKFFGITELSFRESVYQNGDFVGQGKVVSMAIKPTEAQARHLRELLDSLEANTRLGLSEDVRRSLLDLAKYSEAKDFLHDQREAGKTYTAIKEHSRVLPSDTAITKKTVREMRKGLENLVNKGTSLEDAMAIFKSRVVKSNSRLAGYNIHAYDVPSLIETASDQTMKKFFNDSSKRALDFYHGYNAVVENPQSLTGAGLRLEKMHAYLVNNKKIKASKESYLYHLAADDIQANMEAGGYLTKQILGQLQANQAEGSDYIFNTNRINTDVISKGNTLFSFKSGAFDEKRDKYSMIGRIEKGKTVSRWDSIDSSMPSYESFKVDNFFKDVRLSDDPNDTRRGVGVRLVSTDVKDKDIHMFAETMEDLANQIHQRFKKIDPKNEKEMEVIKGLRKIKVEHEAPANRFKKMFEAGGFNRMKHYLSSVEEYLEFEAFTKQEGVTQKQIDEKKALLKEKVVGNKKSPGSPELFEELPHLAKRLGTEEGTFWKNVVQYLDNDMLDSKQKDVAIQYIQGQLDALGTNKGEVTAVGAKMFNFRFGSNDETIFNARDTDSIKGTLRSFIYGRRNDERVGGAEKSYKRARVDDLVELIHENFKLYNDKPKADNVKKIAREIIKNIDDGVTIETALTELSNIVRREVEDKGSGTYVREVMNRLTDTRKNALEIASQDFTGLMRKSIAHASSLRNSADITDNYVLKALLDKQDERISKLFYRNFGAGGLNSEQTIKNAIKKTTRYSDLINGIVEKFSYDFDTQLHMDDNGKMYLVLNEANSGKKSYVPKSLSEARQSASTTVVELPTFQEDLGISYGKERKAAIIKSGYNREGNLYHSTNATDALYSLLTSKDPKELLAEGKPNLMAELERKLNKIVRDKATPYASSYYTYDDKRQFKVKSEVALRTKSGHWDINGLAEKWYKDFYTPRNGKEKKNVEQIKAIARKTNRSFFETMDQEAQLLFQPEMVSFVEKVTDLRGTLHGSAPGQSSKGVIETGAADGRNYMAFGTFYADAGENPNKTRNYRQLEGRYVSREFDESKSYRYRNSLVSSAYAADDMAEEIRGITTQGGYMTDHEVAARLKDANVVRDMKAAIDADKFLSDAEKDVMKRRIDQHMLSTSEGLGMMDYRLFRAFTATEEKRIKLGSDSIQLNNGIESTLKDALDKQYGEGYFESGEWRQKGFKLDKPLHIDVNDLLDENGVMTIGKYMVNDTGKSVDEAKAFRKGDKVSITQLDIDGKNATLVFNRHDKMGHGLKIVTEGAYRGTMVPMVKEALEILYGQKGIDQVITHLSSSKGAFDLPALIRGYETNIRQQINGEFKQSSWVKQLLDDGYTEDDILKKYYEDVRTSLNENMDASSRKLNDKDIYYKDGRAVVDVDLGRDGKVQFNWNAREAFSNMMQERLGLEREIFGDINMAHDVNYRQGAINNGKYTMKELVMLDLAYERAGVVKPGEKSAHVSFIQSMISGDLAQTDPVVRLRQKEFRNVVRAASAFDRGWTPKEGDVVIDYTSDAPGIEGEFNAVKKDGIVHVSPDTFEHVQTSHIGNGQKWTIQDYARTVVNAGEADIQFGDMEKKIKISDYTDQTEGITYMKMQIADKEHFVPIIDTGRLSFGGKDKAEFLEEITSHYSSLEKAQHDINTARIASQEPSSEEVERYTKYIQKREKDALNTIESLKKTIGSYTSGKGAARELTSRRMPMSSQFQTAGINEISSYELKDGKWSIKSGIGIDEGTMVLNSKNVRDMIEGNVENIVSSWDKVDMAQVQKDIEKKIAEGHKGYSLTDWALENWNDYDTFSSTVRYPSISSGTNQALKVKIDDTVGINQVKIARGTASRIKADWDGDNLAVFLSHYGIQDDEMRKKVIGNLADLQKHDEKLNTLAVQLELNAHKVDFEKDLTKTLTDSGYANGNEKIINEKVRAVSADHFSNADVYKTQTVGDQALEDAYTSVIQSSAKNHENWGINKVGEGAVAAEEYWKTTAARSNFSFVGNADAVRMRITATHRSIARVRYNEFGEHEDKRFRYSREKYLHDTALVDDFYREFSQKSISSKKINLKNLTEEQAAAVVASRIEGLHDMINQLGNPNSGMTKNKIVDYLINDIGMYDKVGELEEGKIFYEQGGTYQKTKREFISEAIDKVAYSENTLKEVLGTNSRGLSSTMFAAGSGMGGLEGLVNVYDGGQVLPYERSGEEAAMYASKQQLEVIRENREHIIEGIKSKHIHDVEKTIVNQSENANIVNDIMNTNRRQAGQLLENGDVAIHRTVGDRLAGTIERAGKKIRGSINTSAIGMMTAGAMGFMGLWGSGSLMGKTPTPEGVQQAAAPAPETLGAPPTARVTPNQNGEYINISIKASNARNMSPHDIAAMVNNEIMSQSGVTMNHNVMVSDNSQNINSQWMQEAVANSMNKGYAY